MSVKDDLLNYFEKGVWGLYKRGYRGFGMIGEKGGF